MQLWEGGPFWADRNVGAEEPWGDGLYFWWGDTIGYRRVGDAWVANDGSSTNFSFAKAVDYIPTFRKNAATARKEGWTTDQDMMAPEHDAARVHWGGEWRMPTRQELIDLAYNKCDWTRTTTNGVAGFVVRGRGDYADATIFLPATGVGIEEKWWYNGRAGYLWASEPYAEGPNADCSWRLHFERRGIGTDFCWDRHFGVPVRPVRDE